MIRIGIDVHGLIDKNPDFYAQFTRALVKAGHEIHIITGSPKKEIIPFLVDRRICWTHVFSVNDHLLLRGIHHKLDKKGRAAFPDKEWDKAKGSYCKRMRIQIHLDDSDEYHKHFETPYFLMAPRGRNK